MRAAETGRSSDDQPETVRVPQAANASTPVAGRGTAPLGGRSIATGGAAASLARLETVGVVAGAVTAGRRWGLLAVLAVLVLVVARRGEAPNGAMTAAETANENESERGSREVGGPRASGAAGVLKTPQAA